MEGLEIIMPVVAGVGGLIVGFIYGAIWGDLHAAKERAAEKKELEQQQMWNEYINALREGKNGN